MSAKDGGPVFPQPGAVHEDGTTEWTANGYLSLRDYFAGLALQGLIAGSLANRGVVNGGSAGACKTAYDYADAMLRARGEVDTIHQALVAALIDAKLSLEANFSQSSALPKIIAALTAAGMVRS